MVNNEIKGEVLHIVSPEKAINYKWEDEADLLPDGIQIISIDDINNLPAEIRYNRFGRNNVKINDVFLLDPYSDRYVLAAEAEKLFREEKFNKLSEIASLLGASRISYERVSKETKKRELIAEGKVYYKAFETTASMKNTSEEIALEEFFRSRSFPGVATTEGYERAKELCENTGLIQEFDSLLSLRDPSHPNPMKSDYYEFEVDRELNTGLDLAFSLNVMKGVFTLNAGVQEAISVSKRIKIKMYIEF